MTTIQAKIHNLFLNIYRDMNYDKLANARIQLQKVIDHDTEIDAVHSADVNKQYLQLMDQALEEKEAASHDPG